MINITLTESRATMASSMAGSDVFASKENGTPTLPADITAMEEDKILKVIPVLKGFCNCINCVSNSKMSESRLSLSTIYFNSAVAT